MVLSVITIMTAMVYDFQDVTTLHMQMATNFRDEVKAHYLARSAVSLTKLVLHVQKTYIDPFKQHGVNIQLWQYPFVDSGAIQGMTKGTGSMLDLLSGKKLDTIKELAKERKERKEENKEGKSEDGFAKPGFTNLGGTFTAEIIAESGRININRCCNQAELLLMRRQLEALFMPAHFNPLFENKRSDGQFYSREKTISAIIDWIDPDTMRSGQEGGFEDDYYQQLTDPYKSKNAKFDTLRELLMVRGIDDDFFHAFGKQLTIYSTEKVNVSTADPDVIKALIRAFVRPNDPLRDPYSPALHELVQKYLFYRAGMSETGGILFNMNPVNQGADFVNWLKSNGVMVDERSLLSVIDTKNRIFTVKATARVGASWKRITVVLDNQAGGRIIYWRED